MNKKEIHRKVLEHSKKYGMGKEIFEEGFVEGQRKELLELSKILINKKDKRSVLKRLAGLV
jgi:hypothetical protein